MNCEKYANLINDLVEGELDLQTAEELNLHIFACETCEAEFEILSREKEIYTHFLFEIEPPNDLSTRFQANLQAVEQKKFAFGFYGQFSNLFSVRFFKPILAGAIVLFIFGYFGLRNSEQTKLSSAVSAESIAFEVKTPSSATPEIAKVKTVPPKRMEKISLTKSEPKANEVLIKKPFVRQNKSQNLNSETAKSLEEFQVFQIETSAQLEKVEMLFRSFRNARFVEDREEYDVDYEKQQAKKLLETNMRLRRKSEKYGTILENEMLSKVEPYLLEISNLSANPTQEEVLEIKQRIKNQNLIAGLQGF